MAYLRKTKSGWRAEIERHGMRDSKVLPTKEAARSWAAKREADILAGSYERWPRRPVADALERYGREVSPRKATSRFEQLRLIAFARDYPALAAKIISAVTTADLAAWRDSRLATVTRSSVQRDINLLRNVWSIAAREWQWCPEPTPWRSLRMPGNLPPRQRLPNWREIRRIARRLGYVSGQQPTTTMQEAAWAMMVSLRTAMRAGEVLGLTGETVDLKRRVAVLERHKTAEQVGRRTIPLPPAAVRLLAVLARPGPLFSLSSASLDALWRRARDSVLIDGLHFHDLRAAAATALARRVDVMTLARITGHRDLRTLLDAYYRESPEQIAARMASPKR